MTLNKKLFLEVCSSRASENRYILLVPVKQLQKIWQYIKQNYDESPNFGYYLLSRIMCLNQMRNIWEIPLSTKVFYFFLNKNIFIFFTSQKNAKSNLVIQPLGWELNTIIIGSKNCIPCDLNLVHMSCEITPRERLKDFAAVAVRVAKKNSAKSELKSLIVMQLRWESYLQLFEVE